MWRLLCLMGLLLAGCASHPPAPVAERNAPTVIEAGPGGAAAATAPAVAGGPREGYYIVKKGDTLRHIAQEHGVDFHDLAAWNNIENPSRIEIGQSLRVVPPDGVVVKPVTGPGQVQVVGEATHATGANTESSKREPRGGTVAYSDKALAQMRALDGGSRPEEVKPADKAADRPADSGAPQAVVPPVATATGGIEWAWPAAGKVLAGFIEGGGSQPSNKGIDIAGHAGDPVLAAAAGKVTYVGTLRGYGNLVIVKHDTAYLSAYAHNSKNLVKEGQSIARGQKLAEVGSSDTDQPKLHFEIRYQGKPVDPLKLLPVRP